MTTHLRKAKNAEEIAKLLRSKGRMVITAPPECGKTTELIRYAEERYPNGRFTIVCAREENRDKIIKLHWNAYNKYGYLDIIAKKLLGEEITGEDVNEPTILTPEKLYFPNDFIPVFADDWNLLPKSARRAILRRNLFIAAVGTEEADAKEEEGENR